MANFESLKTTTLRDFSGGLDVVHDDLNMDSKYSKIERNMFLNIDGTKAKRYGTHYEFDLKGFNENEVYQGLGTFEQNKEVTIQQDTVHDINESSKIKIISPTELAGEYNIDHLWSASTFAYITINKTTTGTRYDTVTYQIGNKNSSDTYTYSPNVTDYAEVITKDKQIRLHYSKNPKILTGYKIKITSPSALQGIYTVLYANDSTIQFTVPKDATVSGAIEYTYTNTFGTVYNKYSSTSSSKLKNYLNFTLQQNNRYLKLYAGNKINISGSSYDINKEYTITKTDNNTMTIDLGDYTISATSITFNAKNLNKNIKGTRIIDCTYYVDKIIAVSDIGEVVMIGGTGLADKPWESVIIFNDTIAKTINLETEIEGWHKTDSVSFAVFNGILTVWNGRDKPLAVDFTQTNPCNYLIDAATGSNANVPIAKYALAFNHYLVCANIFDDIEQKQYSDRISISARDSIGTFYSGSSDDVDNDGVYIDLGKIISANKQVIKGLSRYRDKIAVGFDEVTVFGTLGTYTETTETINNQTITTKQHVPNFEDVISNHGCISGRTYANIKSELVCLDYSGIPLFRRSNVYSSIIPTRISELIAPDLYQSFTGLTEDAIENRIFSVINPKNNQYLLFIPNSDKYETTTEYNCYAYTLDNTNTVAGGWSLFTGWNFQCGLTTALNEVLLCDTTKFYSLGNVERPYYADFIDDPNYPPQDEEDASGKEIEFEWEFPWADFGNRASVKNTRYLSLSTTGLAKFDVDLYVDYFYYKVNEDNDAIQEKEPHLSINFIGGDSYGYGNGQQPYGGGRRTNTEQLFAYPCRFKICKFNINGSSKYKLNINSITIYYQEGNIRI